MDTTNAYSYFTADPSEFNTKALKEKLAITLITLIRSNEWSQSVAAQQLKVTQPRVSNLMSGKLDKFSVDTLLQMIFRIGYTLDYTFDVAGGHPRLEMKLKKAML